MSKLILKNISYSADYSNILSKINLTANSGKVTAILGPSGSGKSTIIKIIAGLIKQDSGQIILGKKNITGLEPSERKIGYVSQNPSLLPYYNIWKNISLGLHNISDLQKKKQSLEILESISMEKYIDSFPDQLSIGQQQKISIVRALISKPNILLFDEPYANLDVINKDNLIRQSLSILKKSNAIKLLITHNPHEAMLASDYIYVLNKGKIIQSGQINELHNNPQNEFVARLFGMTNILPASIKQNYAYTILGTHKITQINTHKTQVKLLIRANKIEFLKEQQDNSVAGKITEKRFYYGQYLYFITPQNNKQYQIKLLSQLDYNVGDNGYIKTSDCHILPD